MNAADVVDEVSPIFGRIGAGWYFTPETTAAGAAVGLSSLRFYFLGRGGTLGDVDHGVVSSAFGYFKPAMVEKLWVSARERCDIPTAVTAHLAACDDFGRAHLSGVDGLPELCAAAEAIVTVAAGDPGGLPLFAGYAAQALPDDPAARAMRLIATLRELRGSVHLACVVAAGLPTPVAHAIRRPEMVGFFGWADGEVPPATDEQRAALAEADRMTDAVMRRSYAGLSDSALGALATGARAADAAIA